MSAAALILRIMFSTVTVIVLGVIAVFGFIVIEPFSAAFGTPGGLPGWSGLGSNLLMFVSLGFLGLMLVLVLHTVYAPIRNDRRQQFRR